MTPVSCLIIAILWLCAVHVKDIVNDLSHLNLQTESKQRFFDIVRNYTDEKQLSKNKNEMN